MDYLSRILEIGKDCSIRGNGTSLRELLQQENYLSERQNLRISDLADRIRSYPKYIDEWISYSEDKRTTGGWYLLSTGEIGQVLKENTKIQFDSIEEAVAEYVVRELDFWAQRKSA